MQEKNEIKQHYLTTMAYACIPFLELVKVNESGQFMQFAKVNKTENGTGIDGTLEYNKYNKKWGFISLKPDISFTRKLIHYRLKGIRNFSEFESYSVHENCGQPHFWVEGDEITNVEWH